MKLATFTALALCGSLSVGYSASSLGAEEVVKLSYARICDTSGCYLAWDVVDSDHDGVCDADELMAGTDPYNPLSKPSLQVVAEVGAKHRLPSFEAGLGAFFVYPETMQAFVAARVKDPLAAFPMGSGRKDSLGRAGVSAELLKEHGLDTHDGLTIGIEHKTDTGIPGRRIGGVDVGLISEEDLLTPLTYPVHGDITKDEVLDGDRFVTYADGTVVAFFESGGGMEMDKDGYIWGIWYVDPDADQASTVPTPEQEAAFKRLRRAAIRTVDGWSAPRADTIAVDKRQTVVLLDPEYAYNPATIFDAPKITDAQTEGRPDLPRPDLPANPKGGCTVGCP